MLLKTGVSMRLRQFVKLPKTVISAGMWTDKPMKKSAPPFAMSSSKPNRLGNLWRWRLVKFMIADNGGQCSGRMLIAYQREKQQYQAWAGLETPKGMLLLGRLEWHGSHPGWHVHALCTDMPPSAAGIVKPAGVKRVNRSKTTKRGAFFAVNDLNAVRHAEAFFGFDGLDPETGQTDLFGV